MSELTNIKKNTLSSYLHITPITKISSKKKRSFPWADDSYVYWMETDPSLGGITSIIRYSLIDGQYTNLTSGKYNVRSKIHEYGGIAYAVSGNQVFFVNSDDQNIYHIDNNKISQLTNLNDIRIGEIITDENDLYFIVEDHSVIEPYPQNYIAHINLSNPKEITKVVHGASFYSNISLSPDSKFLSWLQWNLPSMPWESSELYLGRIDKYNKISEISLIDGGLGRSIFQPDWDDKKLIYIKEDGNRGKIYQYLDGESRQLHELPIDLLMPLWQLGISSYKILNKNFIFASGYQKGEMGQFIIDRSRNSARKINLEIYSEQMCSNNKLLILAGSTDEHSDEILSVPIKFLNNSKSSTIKVNNQRKIIELKNCFLNYYPSKNNHSNAIILKVHSGPTSSSHFGYSEEREYWTNRSFDIIELDYRGSTNYGIKFRKKLNGNWGIYDTEDCLEAIEFIKNDNSLKKKKIILKGSSAGGFTVLNTICEDVEIACASCYYAVSDLKILLIDTHKFESGYTSSLLGVKNIENNKYLARSPINKTDKMKTPIIFFQGQQDRVVTPNQTEEIHKKIKSLGIDTEFFLYEDEGHGFKNQENISKSRALEEKFFIRHITSKLG